MFAYYNIDVLEKETLLENSVQRQYLYIFILLRNSLPKPTTIVYFIYICIIHKTKSITTIYHYKISPIV